MLVVYMQVDKYDVMKYTGDGEPPFCMITIKKSISDETTPSSLKCTVVLGRVDTLKNDILQLTRKVDYSSMQVK